MLQGSPRASKDSSQALGMRVETWSPDSRLGPSCEKGWGLEPAPSAPRFSIGADTFPDGVPWGQKHLGALDPCRELVPAA